jgi:peptidoglycan/LPS O-acetylase OafA/YrhL
MARLRKEDSPLGYYPALDGLRGIAVFLVMMFHFQVPGFRNGYFGVDIFFVLSGFLITKILLRKRSHALSVYLSQFYRRRALRLVPALWLVSVIILLVALQIAADKPTAFRDFLITICYVMNWTRAAFNAVTNPDNFLLMGHTWSLAIEEQFYLLWPFILLILLKLPGREKAVSYLCLAAAVLIAAVREYYFHHGASMMRLYNGLDARCDGLLIGAALGLAFYEEKPGWQKWAKRNSGILAWPALVLLIFFVSANLPSSSLLYFTAVSGLAAILILTASSLTASGFSRILSWTPFVLLGEISYGVYLWHWPILNILIQITDLPRVWDCVLTFVLTLAVASLSYVFVEKPVLNRRYEHMDKVSWLGIGFAVFSFCAVLGGCYAFVPRKA